MLPNHCTMPPNEQSITAVTATESSIFQQTRRSLHALFYSLLMLLLAVLYEQVSIVSPFGRPSLLLVIPLTVTVLSVFTLPRHPEAALLWEQRVRHMKFASLCMLGLSPFLSWHARNLGNLYFTIASGLCLLAALWLAVELSMFLELLFLLGRKYRLASLARAVQYGVGYLLLAPVLVTYCFLVPQMIRNPDISAQHLVLLLDNLPPFVHAALPLLLLPLPLLLLLVWLGGRQNRFSRTSAPAPPGDFWV
jgi:hypothetical protein